MGKTQAPMSSWRAIVEIALLFGLPPLFLDLSDAPRWAMHLCLDVFMAATLFYLWLQPSFSWRGLWEGNGWQDVGAKRRALRLFLFLIPVLALLTFVLAPERFLRFPVERTGFWALVMVLYPVLSVIPQEIVFRSFFFQRYEGAFPQAWMVVMASGLWFGVAHIIYGNEIAVLLSALGGMIFAYHYRLHRSLKWASLEHAAYGCLIFTLGLGWFFFQRGGVK